MHLLYYCFGFLFTKTGFLCVTGYSVTHSVDQADFELRDPTFSVSKVSGLKACALLFVCFGFWVFFCFVLFFDRVLLCTHGSELALNCLPLSLEC